MIHSLLPRIYKFPSLTEAESFRAFWHAAYTFHWFGAYYVFFYNDHTIRG